MYYTGCTVEYEHIPNKSAFRTWVYVCKIYTRMSVFRWARRGKGVLPCSSAVHHSSARSSSSSVTNSALTIARRTSRSVRCTSTALRSPQQWRLSLFYEDSFCSTYPGLIIYCYLFKCLLFVPTFQINESKYSDVVFFLLFVLDIYCICETAVIVSFFV